MALTKGWIAQGKQAGRARRNWPAHRVIMMFLLDLNHAHHKIHESVNFEASEAKSQCLACPAHMILFDVVEKCEDLLKAFIFLPFYSMRYTVK